MNIRYMNIRYTKDVISQKPHQYYCSQANKNFSNDKITHTPFKYFATSYTSSNVCHAIICLQHTNGNYGASLHLQNLKFWTYIPIWIYSVNFLHIISVQQNNLISLSDKPSSNNLLRHKQDISSYYSKCYYVNSNSSTSREVELILKQNMILLALSGNTYRLHT